MGQENALEAAGQGSEQYPTLGSGAGSYQRFAFALLEAAGTGSCAFCLHSETQRLVLPRAGSDSHPWPKPGAARGVSAQHHAAQRCDPGQSGGISCCLAPYKESELGALVLGKGMPWQTPPFHGTA